MATLNKNMQRSDFKGFNIQEQDWQAIQDYTAYNFNEACYPIDHDEEENMDSLQDNNKKDISIVKVPTSGSLSFKLNLAHAHSEHPMHLPPIHHLQHIDPMLYYKMAAQMQQMNEDSYSSDENDNDNDSESLA